MYIETIMVELVGLLWTAKLSFHVFHCIRRTRTWDH